MFQNAAFQRAQHIFREIPTLLFHRVADEMGDRPWSSVFVDARRPADTTATVSKLRVVLPDGSMPRLAGTSLERPPDEVVKLLHELFEIKDQAFPDKWYGVRLTVSADGECKVEFNFDPNCARDPAFFKD